MLNDTITYHALGLLTCWPDKLCMAIKLDKTINDCLTAKEKTLLHFHQIGYTAVEIAWYLGLNIRTVRETLPRIYRKLKTNLMKGETIV